MNRVPLTFIAVAPRKRRRRRHGVSSPTPVVLTLVAASVDDGPGVTLKFDRPVNVAGMDVGALDLRDSDLLSMYTGDGSPVVVDPFTVRVAMAYVDEYLGGGVLLSVDPGNGIVPADGGAAWAGVEDLELPFG